MRARRSGSLTGVQSLTTVGAFDPPIPVITPDGRHYAYQQSRQLCDLYRIDGLR